MPLRATFPIDNRHRVTVTLCWWSGLQIYRVNGREVLRKRSFRPNDRIAFDAAGHRVEIELNTFPPRTRALVDGEPVADPLFPQLSGRSNRPLPDTTDHSPDCWSPWELLLALGIMVVALPGTGWVIRQLWEAPPNPVWIWLQLLGTVAIGAKGAVMLVGRLHRRRVTDRNGPLRCTVRPAPPFWQTLLGIVLGSALAGWLLRLDLIPPDPDLRALVTGTGAGLGAWLALWPILWRTRRQNGETP